MQHKEDFRRDEFASGMSLDRDTIKHPAQKRVLFIYIAIIGMAITSNFTDPPLCPTADVSPIPRMASQPLAWPAASRETTGHLLNTLWCSGLQ